MNRCFFFMEDLSASFTTTEINKLSSVFDSVILVTLKQNKVKTYPKNVEFHYLSINQRIGFRSIPKREYVKLIKIFIYDICSKYTTKQYLKLSRSRFYELRKYSLEATILQKKFALTNQDTFYCFFSHSIGIIPSIIKAKNNSPYSITLTHGRDLYEEREPGGKFPFRKYIFQKTNKILSVSKKGSDHLKKKYSEFNSRIFTYYLGTSKKNDLINTYPKNQISIVSVTNIRPLKRIHLIPPILIALEKKFNLRVNWTHIGANCEKCDKEIDAAINLIKNHSNISYEFKGEMSTAEIFNLYENEKISFLLSTSETEGIPFSMMEAHSFAIPVICTNVGGCNEIVKHHNLLLDPLNPIKDIESAAEYLLQNEINIRIDCHSNWFNHFSFEQSTKNLITLIKD